MADINKLNIRRFTWWVTSDRRLFLVSNIISGYNEETKEWVPEIVCLLDCLSEDEVQRPWKEICELVDSKSLKPVPESKRNEYQREKSIKL